MTIPFDWFQEAERVAQSALCTRAKCGVVIVAGDEIIGEGYNAPPRDDMHNAKCVTEVYDRDKKPKYDLTCCVHAEWRAIMDVFKNHPEQLLGATLYYVRLGDDGKVRPSGAPFCTVCSRLALDVGIAKFGLFHKHGPMLYDSKDYNERSYAFHLYTHL